MTARSPVLVIGGPTASGKSGLAVSVARQTAGTVINADSMQLYAGLPILTAQPSDTDLADAPHRLYGALAPQGTCSAAVWRDMALHEISCAHAQGRLPIVVGGTGFYIKTLLEGISPIPPVLPEARASAAERQRQLGNPAFHAELAERDPVMAQRLDPFNTQRLIRAWEVLEATGKSLSYWQSLPRTPPPAHLRFIVAILLPPRETLYAQCDTRFSAMMTAGALEEAADFRRKILAGEVQPDAPLAKALGYPELATHLAGETSLEEALVAARQSTRNYAKRQVTWFRHQIRANAILETPDAAPVLKSLQE